VEVVKIEIGYLQALARPYNDYVLRRVVTEAVLLYRPGAVVDMGHGVTRTLTSPDRPDRALYICQPDHLLGPTVR